MTETLRAMSAPAASPPAARRRFWLRVVLAGPLALVASGLVMAGGALWLPKGAAQIDNLILPIVLFPAIWAALFFYACLDRNLVRAWTVVGGLTLLHAGMIALHLLK